MTAPAARRARGDLRETPLQSQAVEVLVRLRVEGEPVPKARARVVAGHAYTPTRTKKAEADMGWLLKSARRGRGPVDGDMYVRLAFGCRPARRGDLDNLVKLVLDAANGIVWNDDRQVVYLEAAVAEGVEPHTDLEVLTVARAAGVQVREEG